MKFFGLFFSFLSVFFAKESMATIANCSSSYKTEFVYNDDSTIKTCTGDTDKWEYIFDENEKQIFITRYTPSENGWVLQEIEKSYYDNNGQKTQADTWWCNGGKSGSMWGIVYTGPDDGCTEKPFVQKTSNGRVVDHVDCNTNATNATCLASYNNYCSVACKTCVYGTCTACYGDYILKDNICVRKCGAGKYLDNAECKSCPAGTYSSDGDNVCSDCGSHEYSLAGSATCSPRRNTENCSSFSAGTDECSACNEGYKAEGGACVSVCEGGQVYYKNECYAEYPFAKKHYTPDEAAPFLKAENNTITIMYRL